MRYLNLMYKSSPVTISIPLNSDEDGKMLFNGIVECRAKGKDTYIINAKSGYILVDPLELAYCEISSEKIKN